MHKLSLNVSVKKIRQILNGTHGITVTLLYYVTWRAFSKLYRKEKYSNVTLHNFALKLLNKSETDCKRYYEKCKEDIKILQQDLISF